MKVFKPITCLICHNNFIPKSPKALCCGDIKDVNSCRKKHHLQKRSEKRESERQYYTKKCKNCDKEFITNIITKVYCGSGKDKVGCSFIFRNGLKPTLRDLSTPIPCIRCSKQFLPNSASHKMCGDRDKKTGCAYMNYLDWNNEKRNNFTPEQIKRFSEYKTTWHLMRHYKITLDDYYQLLLDQEFKCAICHRDALENTKHRKLFVDHNHETGKVRGLLCHNCNATIGMAFESEDILLKAIDYLKKWDN